MNVNGPKPTVEESPDDEALGREQLGELGLRVSPHLEARGLPPSKRSEDWALTTPMPNAGERSRQGRIQQFVQAPAVVGGDDEAPGGLQHATKLSENRRRVVDPWQKPRARERGSWLSSATGSAVASARQTSTTTPDRVARSWVKSSIRSVESTARTLNPRLASATAAKSSAGTDISREGTYSKFGLVDISKRSLETLR